MKSSVVVDRKEDFVSRWPATLDIEFSVRQEKTVPSSIKHFGPLRVQRPFYPEKDGSCHLYLLHPPAGIVGGDTLNISVEALGKSKSLLTTPGATKIYRSKLLSKIQQSIKLENESVLEWMPQETILFNDAQTEIKTDISLMVNSQLFYWDILCFGLPVNREKFCSGSCKQSLQLSCDEKYILIERNNFEGHSEFMTARWGMRDFYVNAIAIMTLDDSSSDSNIIDQIRLNAIVQSNALFAVTKKQGLIICRYMGDSVEEAKQLFQQAWVLWRQNELGKDVVAPRIWST